jgi:signal transduction histidine kinase
MMASMAVKLPRSKRSLFVRALRSVMAINRSRVRALQDALRLQKSMRIIVLGSAMIVLPSMLLAYFGIASVQGEEIAAMEDVETQGEGAVASFLAQNEKGFINFEERMIGRLEGGRSPLEAATELHPHLLLALKLDKDLNLMAPFFRDETPDVDPVEYLFDPSVQRALSAERRGEDGAVVARLFGRAARDAASHQVRARMRFDRARMMVQTGRTGEARLLLNDLVKASGSVRDPWGFRMEDLVELFRAEGRLAIQPTEAGHDLRTLVDRLMTRRWAVGRGGEGAVARRALSRLEPFSDTEWVAATRERIDDRMRMLYWAEELLPELDGVLKGQLNLSVGRGNIRWIESERGLWALTWWGEDLYAFALDRETLMLEARGLTRAVSPLGSPVKAQLIGPGDATPEGVLARRSLAPWMVGWSVVSVPRDPGALAAELKLRRNRRIGIIVLAIAMIGVGALSTARVVNTELDGARVKADFAANVSHELRSPITQIRLKAESLMLGLSETEEERQWDYRAIVRESERLSRLVDNVLDFSAIERGAKTYALIPGDLGASVSVAIEAVEGSVELVERDLFVRIEQGLPTVAHDSDAISQCVINLLSNAAKYSETDQPICVDVREGDGGVFVRVIDEGIGIPESDIQQIFDPFFRGGDASVRRKKGTGIGLAITHYIVSSHNGSVDVVSISGEGSTFSLWFPAFGVDSPKRKGV